jgi:tripartite-type tricarboxylate transporter receptor subunit TctC
LNRTFAAHSVSSSPVAGEGSARSAPSEEGTSRHASIRNAPLTPTLSHEGRGSPPPGRIGLWQSTWSRCRRTSTAWLALFAATLSAQTAAAQSVEEFYKGKNVNLLIGFSAGGGYDLYARHLARHIGRHIPGSPTIIPQNMAGAGSLRAASFLYSAAPKDGSVFGTFARTTGINPLLESGAHFDGTKFSWIGSVTDDVSTCVTWHTSPVKTWADFLTKPITLGGQGPSSEPDIFARLFKSVFGAPVKLVAGYPGTNEISLAMERGEVDGLCGLSWSTIKTRHAAWYRDKKINIIVQSAFRKEPELGDVPLVMDMTKDPEKIKILRLILAAQEMARPFAAPPGIPADRKAALIAAFDATMKDPEYLAEAKKMKIDVNPVAGPALDKLLAELYATPKDVVAKAAKAIAN